MEVRRMSPSVAFAAIFCAIGLSSAASESESENRSIALFVFGDSLSDAGNNNFIPNTTSRANFPPYGRTFFGHPTGRFTDGRTVFDFIASTLRIPFPPPFLQQGANFSHGINFASGGSGLLDSTGKDMNIIPLSHQIKYYKRFSSTMVKRLGPEAARSTLSKALITISIGGNDFGLNYLVNTSFQNTTSHQEFVKLLLSHYKYYLESLYRSGARNFLLVDIAPVGCTPNFRLAGVSAWNGECVDTANQLIALYNARLTQLLSYFRANYKDGSFLNVHSYNFILHAIHHGQAYGFSNTTSACCGAGPFNTAVSCGKDIPEEDVGKYEPFLCENPEEFLFWDGTHPTESAYHMISHNIWEGNSSFISPYNLRTLIAKLNA